MEFFIKKYQKNNQKEWDAFVLKTNNGTFLHQRNYMDYHANRFDDYSIMIYKKNKLIGILPAHIIDNEIFSHNGLTYSEILYHNKLHLADKIEIAQQLVEYLKNINIKQWHIKSIPNIFHRIPDDANLYIYPHLKSKINWIKPFFVIFTPSFRNINRNRKRSIASTKSLSLKISQDQNYLPDYWRIIEQNLATRHRANPVHLLTEMQLLIQKFPKEIQFFACLSNNEILAGAIVYKFNNTAHFQYIHANNQEDKRNAVDFLTNYLIEHYKNEYTYISFGSAEKKGFIDQGLSYWKESFGAQIINQYAYQIDIDTAHQLNQIMQ